MFDPRDPYRHGPAYGIVSAFFPQTTLGCLAGLFLIVLAAVVAGVVQGWWLAAAVVGLVVLVPLIRRALRAEIRREDASESSPSMGSSLPPDADLSEEERRDAMRRFERDEDEGSRGR